MKKEIFFLFVLFILLMTACQSSGFYFHKRIQGVKTISANNPIFNPVFSAIEIEMLNDSVPGKTDSLSMHNSIHHTPIITSLPETKTITEKHKISGQKIKKIKSDEKSKRVVQPGKMWLCIFLLILIVSAGAALTYILGVWLFGTSLHIFLQSVLFLFLMLPVTLFFKTLLALWSKLLKPKTIQ